MQEEEIVEVREELEPLVEESIKMKTRAKEAEIEQRDESIRILISDKASTLMEKSPKDKGFIVERGFKKLTPLSLKCLRREDNNHLASTRHLAVLHLLKNFLRTWWKRKKRRYMSRKNG